MITERSRYANCALFVDGREEFIGARTPVDTSPRPDDLFHTVAEGDRIDRLAYRYLGRADLWWVICDYNDIANPMELPAGEVLRIPSSEHVEMRVLG